MFTSLSRRVALSGGLTSSTKRFISVQVAQSTSCRVDSTHGCQSLLHGSPEAKEAGDLEKMQHSRLVGRGKYIHGFESTLSSSFAKEQANIEL
jgi:hypothetical protein